MRSLIQTARTALAAAALVALTGSTARAQSADVQIIHNSPDPMAAVVDIYVDGGLAVPDLAFREATPIVPLPAGSEIVIGIAPGTSSGPGDIIATFPATLTPGESYIVMAAGVLDTENLPENPDMVDTAFSLYVKPGLRAAGVGSDVDLIAFHGSPDAPTVDVRLPDSTILFGGLQFTDFAADYISVPPASYVLEITPAGVPETTVAAYEADVTALGGGAAVVFASGFFSEMVQGMLPAFGLFVALPDGTVLELMAPTTPTEQVSWSHIKAAF
jgi:hypothetical protein